MFKRRIEEELKSWKISTIRKPLVLRGARQVGKTSTVRKFAAENFENFVEINLERADQNKYFRQADTVEEFVKRAEYFTKKVILEGRTLLFIDEIQESFEILKLLRFFAEENRIFI